MLTVKLYSVPALNTARRRHLLSILAVSVQTDIHPHPSSTEALLCSQGTMVNSWRKQIIAYSFLLL